MSALNIGLIGAGRIGIVHAETIAYRIPGANLVAIADPNIEAAKSLAARLDVEYVFEDAKDVWNHPDVDAVIIASATHTHAEFIVWAAEAGKDIFCEKPIAFDLDEIDAALEAVARAGVKLQIGFNRRFDPNFAEVQRAVAAGEIGVPHILRITSRDPAPPPVSYIRVSGGMFFDMTIHDFDMARFLCGEVVRVHAFAGCRIDPAIEEAGDIDTAVVTLEFENGAFGTIDNSRKAVYGYDQRVEVFGSDGAISAENDTPHRTTLSNADGVHQPLPLNFFMTRYTASYAAELEAFIDAVHNDTEPLVGGIDGRKPVVIAMAAVKSLATGRTVSISEI